MKKYLLNILALVPLIFLQAVYNDCKATHIVGGQFSYTYLGNNKYEIRLVVRRDCINGAGSVYFDDPAEIAVFYGDSQRAWRIGDNGVIEMDFLRDDTIRENIITGCFNPGQVVCVHESIYNKVITLPETERGYILAYQRCCRNQSLSNIIEPLETGTTYAIAISAADLARHNSSPLFGNFPPIYSCVDKAFTFNHSAVDVDGDVLVYSLCLPNIGKTRQNPQGVADPPPYDSVKLKSAYSINNLLNPNGTGIPLSIDPVTGILTGTPNTIGQYLVGVCVTEYKNGVKMSSVTRDFELNIVPCGNQPTAAFDITSNLCSGLTQTFSNKSTGAISFEWFFDFPNNLNLTSTNPNPKVTYPKEGTYTVVLVVRNNGCVDSLKKVIKVINSDLKADFTFATECSPNLKINAKDNSTSSATIISYNWVLNRAGQNTNSALKDPIFTVNSGGVYNLTLLIIDSNGCRDSITKPIEIKSINIDLIGGNYVLCLGDSVHLVKNPDKSLTYTWSPTNGLNLKDPSDPIASPITTTTYKVTISDGNCVVEKEVTILVRGKLTFNVMGDTITCDGNISLMASSDSTTTFEWSYNSNFMPIEFTGAKFNSRIKGDKLIYVRAGSGEQCKDNKIIHLLDRALDFQYQKENKLCENDSVNLVITNNRITDVINIKWLPESLIRSGQGTLNPKLNINSIGTYSLIFTASNQFGCVLTDTITFIIRPNVKPDLKIDFVCGSLKVNVSTTYRGKLKWNFGDGTGMSTKAIDEYIYSKSGKYTITLMADTACSIPSTFVVDLIKLDFNLPDSLIKCQDEEPILNINADTKYKYQWSPDTCFVNSKLPNPILKGRKSGKYYVDYYDTTMPSCIFRDSITVFFPSGYFITAVAKNPIVCVPDSVLLEVNTNVTSTQWCDKNGKNIGTGTKIKVYVDRDTLIVVKGIYFNCTLFDTIRIKYFDFNSKIVGPDLICPRDTVKLAVVPSDPNWTYNWTPIEKIIGSNVGSEITVSPTDNTTYSVIVRNALGCEWTAVHTVNVSDIGKRVFATADPSTVIAGGKSQLSTINNSNYKYKWEPNDSSLSSTIIYNPIATPKKTTTYSVTVTDENGCTGVATVTVIVGVCDESVFVPNAFTPNADGKNDLFLVRGLFLKKIDFHVYNRWGEEMFGTQEIGQGWDGTFKGDKLGPDVYGWYLIFTCPDDKEFVRKGNVSLLK